MRILVVTSGYLSGNGNWVADQVASLRSAGIDVDVIFVNTKKTRLNYAVSMGWIARAIASGTYDLVHTHHSYTLLLVDIAKRVVGSGVPVVLTSHEGDILDPKLRARTWHPTSYLRHSVRVKQFAAKRAAFVVFVSRALADAISVDVPHDVIPCGVDLGKFRPLDRHRCRQALGLPSGGTIVFFPADPRRRSKRFELARDAYELVRKDLRSALLLVGGNIPADSMPLYYNASDVVLQTSFCEASPMVIKEALGCEVPVISTDVGDTKEIIHGLPYCWICSEDSEEIARRIFDTEGRRAVGARERLVRMELSIEQVAQRVIRVYKRVLGVRVAPIPV